jgi:hypothetical protein
LVSYTKAPFEALYKTAQFLSRIGNTHWRY